MRILLLLTLLATNFIFAQVGSTIVQQGNAISKDTVHFAIINYDKDVTYIIDFGDNNNRFIEKNSFDSSKSLKYVYNKEGHYSLKLSKLNNDASKSLLDILIVEVEKPRTKLKINKVTFHDYSPIKPDGRAWDNVMGGTYPDVFILFYSAKENKALYNQTPIKYDVKTKTDVSWEFTEAYINEKDFEDGFRIEFNDYDSFSSHDTICNLGFKNLLHSGYFKKKEGVVKIDDVDKYACAFSIEYSWE